MKTVNVVFFYYYRRYLSPLPESYVSFSVSSWEREGRGGGREREGGERERKGGRGEKKGGRGERKGWRKGICVFYYLLLPSSFWIGRREVAENVFFFWYVLEFHSGAIIAHSLIMGLGFKVSFVGVLESFEMNLY